MNCKEYQELTIIEKIQFIGKLNHLCQTNSFAFGCAQNLISQGEKAGLFVGVEIKYDNESKKPTFFDEKLYIKQDIVLDDRKKKEEIMDILRRTEELYSGNKIEVKFSDSGKATIITSEKDEPPGPAIGKAI